MMASESTELNGLGFLIIIAKLSDIFGRKALIQSCLVVFVAFSIGCGAARSLTQLYGPNSFLYLVTN